MISVGAKCSHVGDLLLLAKPLIFPEIKTFAFIDETTGFVWLVFL